MADVNIDMLLSDSTRSIGRRRREVQGLNQDLERTQGLSSGQARGGEREGYDRARGAVGTGAAGRDFANQSRGLGGVVALYATFAANIFAVSAAFQNLQQAANFERLIKASEMMSERTGINLKGLGKNLQEATGYAISFEDAMQFANLGTSAGIAAKQMTSLVEIAKGAASGLGRDVQDSVRRIIQGTAKQEQEILDELGIFIKAKKAYDDYAKKFQIVGGADALSAQQRVAAYADAVEQAGTKWKDFAKIDDPFSRFVATGKEALMEMLNFINKGIKPLIGFLAESKDAIIALATVISLSLARRALPQLKDLFVDLFTYNKTRARALAQQQRMDIAKEMALTSNLIATEQAKLAALSASNQALTMQAVAGTFAPGMLAKTGAKGQAIGPGIAPKKLEQAVFGTAAKPVDLASYTKVTDVEKQYKKAIDETIGKNQVKLDQMKQLGVLQNASILGETKLTAATKASAAALFASIQQYNSGLITRLELERQIGAMQDKNAARAATLVATTPGAFSTVDRYKRPPLVGPTQPVIPSTLSLMGSAITAPIGAMATATKGIISPVTTAYTKAVAEIGENSKQMANAMGAGLTANLKQAAVVLKNHGQTVIGYGKDVYTAGKQALFGGQGISKGAAASTAGLAAFSVVSATTAAALSTLGLALRGLMAALGPLMLLWAAWEMGLKDLVLSATTKATMALNAEFKNLEATIKTSSSALNLLIKQYDKGILSSKEYSNTLEIFNNAIRSQIDGLQKLLKAKQDYDDALAGRKAKKEAEGRGEVFSEEAYALEKTITVAEKLGTLRDSELEELKAIAKAYKDIEKTRMEASTSTFFETKGYKTKLGAEEVARQERLKLAEQQLPILGKAEAAGQRKASTTAQLAKASEDIDNFMADYKKKLNRIPELGELASTEAGKSAASIMNTLNLGFKEGADKLNQTDLRLPFNDLLGLFEKLAPTSENAAHAVTVLSIAIQEAGIAGKDLDYNKLFKILQGFQPKVIKDIDNNLKKFTSGAEKGFRDAEAAINNYTLSIMRLDFQIQKTSGWNTAIEGIRGYSSELEISTEKTLQVKKAQAEFNREVAQAELEYSKVKNVRDQTGTYKEDLAAADVKLKFARDQAGITKTQKVYTAEVAAENKLLESTLKQIEQRYETINRKLELQYARAEGTLRIEEERLRILREAGAYSEPKLVELETQGQQRQIESTFGKEKTTAVNAAQKEIDLLNERFDVLIKNADTDEKLAEATEAKGIALARLNDIERDAIKSAENRRDIDLEVLRISSQAKKIYAELAETEKTLAQAEALRKTGVETQSQLLDLQKQELQYKLDIGLITQDIYDKETRGLDKVIRLQEFKNKQLEIEAKYQETLRKIETDRRVIESTAPINALGDLVVDPAILAALKARGDTATTLRNAELSGLTTVFNKTEQLKDLYDSLSARQKSYGDIFKNVFDGMADAIMDFVKTGKLNFSDLIDSMLADLLRYELKLMTMEMYKAAKPGLMNLVGSLFGGGQFGVTPIGSSGYGGQGYIGGGAAKGAYFSGDFSNWAQGAAKFAKGGMFTNSIVDSPTMFKFAKGTGIMGEAGPEAIMPLKRDSQGNLGVRGGSGGGNVEVVVNNYGTEKAETRETTDARGNRRVEVIVGEMTAGEVTRSGSMTNRAMRGTFGLQPQLIRR